MMEGGDKIKDDDGDDHKNYVEIVVEGDRIY